MFKFDLLVEHVVEWYWFHPQIHKFIQHIMMTCNQTYDINAASGSNDFVLFGAYD